MPPATEEQLPVVARVVKPHGIRGELVVEPLSEIPDRLAPGIEVVIGGDPMTVAGARPHKGRLLLAVEGVPDRTAAEHLRGAEIRAAPVPSDDREHLLVSELVGVEVRLDDGVPLGTVAAVIDLPAAAGYDLLEVARPDGTTLLIPAAEDLVAVEVGEDSGGIVALVVTDPPDGLLEL